MIFKNYCLAATFIIIFKLPASAFALPIVGDILDEFSGAAQDVINAGFDRLDRSMVGAGNEFASAASALRETYAESLTKTVNELDGQQKRAINDLQTVIASIENAENAQLERVIQLQSRTMNKIYNLISSKALVLGISQNNAQEGDRNISITAKGVAFSQDKIKQIKFAGKSLGPNAISAIQNNRVTFTLPLAGHLTNQFKVRGTWKIPFVFTIKKCKLIGLIGCKEKFYKHSVIVFPKQIATLQATFTGQVNVPNRKRIQRGPFISARVKSRLKWNGSIKAGERVDMWHAKPDTGWVIDVPTSKYAFQKMMGSCSGSRAFAAWSRRDNKLLTVRATTGSDRKAGATCRTRTTITFDQVKTTTANSSQNVGGKNVRLALDGQTPLQLPNNSKLLRPRLAHVTVTSPLFRASQQHKLIITPSNPDFGAIRTKYQPANNTVYVSLR